MSVCLPFFQLSLQEVAPVTSVMNPQEVNSASMRKLQNWAALPSCQREHQLNTHSNSCTQNCQLPMNPMKNNAKFQLRDSDCPGASVAVLPRAQTLLGQPATLENKNNV